MIWDASFDHVLPRAIPRLSQAGVGGLFPLRQPVDRIPPPPPREHPRSPQKEAAATWQRCDTRL